jgi:hypothetical protein
LESLHTASFNRIMLIPACAQTNVAVWRINFKWTLLTQSLTKVVAW